LQSLPLLLSDPNAEDPLVPEVAQLFKKNRKRFNKIAKECQTSRLKSTPNMKRMLKMIQMMTAVVSEILVQYFKAIKLIILSFGFIILI
jgi:hypothetical protein